MSRERRTGRFLTSLLGTALVASLLTVAAPAGPTKAAGETLVTPAATRVVPNTSGAALSDDFNIAGYQSGDTLLTNVSLSGPSGTSFSIPTTTGLTLGFGYSSWTGRTELSFTGNQANTNNALDSMTVSTGATSGTAILTVSTTLSAANTYYYAATGRFYQAVASSGITWTNANTAATNATYKGRPGYLVTITSADEQNFLNNNVSGNNIWIGLTDKDCEGTWKWQGGPEAGQTAFQATNNTGCNNTTSAYSSAGTTNVYANWCGGEPNNADGATGEDMAVTKWSGGTCWNDLRDGNSSGVSGYVIEYGDSQAFTDFLAGNMTIAVSTTPGTIASVTSDLLNGTYGRGQNIDIKVNFTDPVNVTGSPRLTLDPTGNDNGAVATYLSGSGTSTLVFRYTVLEGHTDSDLNYTSTSALSLNGGTITLVSGGANATLTLPATSASESLGGSKNLVISTTTDAPSSSITAASLAAYTTSASVSIPYTASDPSTTIRSVTAFYSTSSSLTSPQQCGTTTSATSPNTVTCTLPATNTTYYLYTRATDAAGVQEAAPVSADDSIILDNVAPAFNTLSASPNPVTASSGQTATVTFTLNESVTTFSATDLAVTYGTLSNFSGSGSSYTATFTPTRSSSGPAVLTIAAGGITDLAGNSNVLATLTISITATNGRTTYTSGGTNYIVERFTTVGASTWIAPRGVSTIDALVIGGGGGAGSRGAGGGGAGGYVEANNYAVTAGSTYNVTIGAGGAGAAASTWNSGSAGSASSFLRSGVGLTANGGGAGNAHGSNSASGGNSGAGSGTGGTAYQNNGGTGRESSTCGTSDWCGGGGGGAGSTGGAASTTAGQGGGAGGSGRASTITGASVTYAGGGGGGGGSSGTPSSTPSPGGTGGSGGGGAGATSTWNGTNCTPVSGTNGTDGLGGGGGGGSYCDNSYTTTHGQGTGGSGGSGIVILRYSLPAITTPDLDDASDLGTSTTDNKTSDTTPTFSGFAPVGSEVQLYANSVATGSVCYTNDTTGIWLCTTATLATGTYSITAVATTTLETTTVTSTSSALSIAVNTYNLTYDSQGGSSVSATSWNAGSSLTLPTPTRAGYTFTGWSTTATGSTKVYETTNPVRSGNSIVYASGFGKGASDAAQTLTNQGQTFNRVRYRMEVNYSGTLRYADVSFDKWSGATTISALAVPDLADQRNIKTNVTNLTVDSNWPGFSGVASAVTNGRSKSGRLELWARNYAATTTGITPAGSGTVYDNDDTENTDPAGYYGSFQVHNLTDGETVLAWNNHSVARPDLGFGNYLVNNAGLVHTDWTFSANTNFNLATWKMQIYIADLFTGGTSYTPSATSDLTLYAQWEPVPYTVTYNGNTQTSGVAPTDSTSYYTNNTATVLGNTGSLARTGFTFSGWCTTQPAVGSPCGGTSRAAGSTFTVTADTTLYAVWIDSTAPTLSSTSVNAAGTKVILTYDEALSTTTAATTAFAVVNNGYPNPVSAVAVSGSTIELTLTETIPRRQTVTVAYTDPTASNDSAAIQDLAGNDAASRSSATAVTNSSTATIPLAARLIGLNTETVVTLSGATGGVRGITGDGTNVYFRMSSDFAKIFFVPISSISSGTTATVTPSSWDIIDASTNVKAVLPAYEQTQLAYSSGCIFFMTADDASSLKCVDTTTRRMTSVAFPATPTPPAGRLWLLSDLVSFPDGRIGKIRQITGSGSSYSSDLVMYNVTRSGGNTTLTFSETMTLSDIEAFPGDDHGFATDGVYGYRLNHTNTGYKVWRLQSGSPSNVIFDGDASSGTCDADLGGRCVITLSGITNATFMGYDPGSNRYFVGDYGANKFYMTEAANPGVGPGTAPVTVSSFSSAVSSPAASPSPTFTLTFNTAVTGVTSADFSNTGSATCTFAVTAVSTTVYTVTPTCDDGTVRPQFAANGAVLASNGTSTGPAFANSASTTVTVAIPPTITAFSSTTADGSYRAGQAINITATVSETIPSGETMNVVLNTGATVTLTSSAQGTTLTGTYTVAASQTTSDLTVSSYTVGTVNDLAGNAMTSTTLPAGANIADTSNIAVDTTSPSIVSFTSAHAAATQATSFTFTITFSEAVTGITSADFANSAGAGRATGCSFDPGADTASTMRTVTVTGCSEGSVAPTFAANGATDGSGNTGPAATATASATITRDTTAPTVTSFSSSTANGSYRATQTVNITATASESVQSGASIVVTLDTGDVITLTAASAGTTMTGTYTIGAGDTSADLTVSSFTITSVTDAAGNAMTSTAVPSGSNNIAGTSAIVIDTTAPTVVSFTSANSTPTNSASLTFTVTFSEAVTGVAAADFNNTSGTATGCVFAPGTDSGTTRTVTITSCGAGTVNPTFVAGGATDSAGNTGPASAETTTTPITRDTTAPTVTSFSTTTSDGFYNAGDTINITATLSESVRSNSTITVTLNSAAGATVALTNASAGSTLSGTYTVAAGHTSADLTVSSFALTSAPIDIAGNTMTSTTVPAAASNIAGVSAIVVDTTSPSAPTAVDLTTASDTGTSSTDHITDDTTPNIGLSTLETSASVTVTATSGASTKTCSFTASAATGACDLDTLTEGTWVVTATQTDPAGNQSAAATSLTIYVDTTGPATPTGLSASAGSASVTISFTPGVGGPSAVTNYKYSLDGTTYIALSPADSTSPITISGLTNDTTYTIRLKTVTAMGDSAASASVTATPSRVAGLATISYTEQEPATPIASSVALAGGSSYDGKYIDFAIGSPQATEILGYTTSGTASTSNGAVSIVGTSVYLGNGTTADPIGSIDSTRNGQNGQPLRINFVNSFSNASFETGTLDGWNYLDQQINLGVTQIAGYTTVDTSTYPGTCSGVSSNDHAVTNVAATAFNQEIITSTVGGNPGVTDGTRALRLFSSMTASPGGYIIHGPAVYSEPFSASAGDTIYFDWRAANGGDNYHVFGYILNTATGTQTELLDATGSGTTSWTTKATTIPASGDYRFVFVSGTHDANCATGGGASLYIDNVQVFGSKVTDAVASNVAKLVTYRNTSDAPSTTRTVTFSGNPTGGTFSKTFDISVTLVGDPPTLTATSTSYTNAESTAETFTPKTGNLAGSDPDGDTLTYSLPNGTTGSTTTYSSVTYDVFETGTYGTLWIKASTGQYYYAPDNTAINNRLTNDADQFDIRATASGVDADSTFTLSISITAAAPAVPTGLTVTPGVRALAVSWTAPTWIGGAAVTGYRIEYSTNNTTWTTFSDNTSTATSIRVTGLADNTAYYVRVASKNTNGTGSYASSSPTTYTTFDKPTSLTLTPVGGTVVANTLNSTNTNLTAQATIVAGRLTGGTATLYRGSTALATDTSIGASDTTVTFDMGASTTAELQGLIATGGSITVKVVDANGLETLASTAVTLTVDYTRPTVGITRAGSGVLNQGTSDTITFTLSESSSNFVSSDVTVSGGTLSALSGSGTSYTGTFTVSSGATGSATLSVLGSAFTDAAGNGNSASSTLTISLNSAPTLGTPTTASYTDTIASDTFATTTGTLVGADTDSGDTLTYGITSGTDGGTTVSRTGTYGTLTVTKATGAYSFAPNNSAINIRAANASETYTVTVTDGIQTTSATFTVSITAANDAPVMTMNAASATSFTDTAANDTFTVQTGTFAATDVESNTISTWGITGATTVSSLLAWTSGSITFDRLLVGTYGSLYVRSASGQYRFEPNNAAINALSAGTSELFPVTVADNLGATGTGSFTASITAVNDRPVVTVTAANLADVTAGLATSAYSLYHSSAGTGSSPGGEEVYRAFDDSSSTKYLNFSGAGSGVTIDLGAGSAYAVNGLGLTTANDSSERDPTSYEVYGSNNGTSFTLVSSGTMTAPTSRFTDYTTITFSNSAVYRWYRVVFPAIRTSGNAMQIGEIRLPAQSGNLLSYTEGAPAGVVLTGIDVTDADTASLTGATVSITAGLTTGDVLAFTNDGSTMGSISGSYDSGTGVLTLSGAGTPTQYQNAFRAVTFRNTTNNPTANSATRTVTWRANDGDALNNLSTAVTSTITVIETAASISSIAITSSAGTDSRYAIGETVEVSATFTEAVTVIGSPRMAVNGLSSKFFTYSAGSGTQTLVFSYTVVAGDSAASGVGVASNALALNGGAINDSVAAAATITHSAVALSSSHIVDGVLPTVTAFSSSTSDGSYMAGGAITISATISETVQANSSIDATLDTGAVVTLSNSSSGTTLSGTYMVGANQNSTDLIVSSYSITSVLDVAGNAMTSTTVPSGSSNIAGTKALIVDTTAPTISQMAVSADGSYKADQSLTITATANEAIRMGNTLTVTFDTGETLLLTAATAGTTFTGTYTVTSGINSTDLTVTAFSIGTVLDTAGNSMTSTTLPTGANAIGTGTAVVIDTTAPTVASFTTTTANGSYKAGQTVNITANVSEPVQAGNTVSVTLNSGATVTLSTPADTQSWSATVGGVTCGPYTRRTVTGSLTGGTVWGSGPYTDDSNFNRAAVHAGLVAVGQTAVIEPYNIVRISSYTGSTQNGVTTTGYSSPWCGYSIRLATGVSATSTTLTGTYTIAAGQTAAMLNVDSFSIGTVADGAGNAMTSTTVPGGSNIADSSSVVVDTTAPTIASFSSTTPNGAFKTGQTINITATASEAVRSGNTITATLNTNRTVLLTAPVAGTGFSGTYTVLATDTTSSLTVTSFTIGSVLDTAGNAMTSNSMPLSANNVAGASALVVDTTAPTVSSFSSLQTSPTSSTTFAYTITFSEAVTGIVADDFSNTGTATCSFDPGTDTSATTRTVTATCTTKGTVTPQFDSGAADDIALNTGPASVATATTTITINNIPVLPTPTTASYTDTTGVDTYSPISGDLGASDVDPGDALTYSITSGTDNGATVSRVGTYGTLSVTKATGAYTFTPDDSAISARSANTTETHTVTVTDGIQTASATFTVSITAVNDLPVVASVAFSFTDTAAKDTFTVQLGQFMATDAESNTISSWDVTGSTTLSPASPLPWSTGTLNFDRVFTNSYGSLYLQSSSGKYRFEPDAATLNALTTAAATSYLITATDSASSIGSMSLGVSMTAVNDNPIATVTVGTIADVTDGLATSAYTLYHSTQAGGSSSPPTEQVWRAFDNDAATKYLNYAGAGSGVAIDLGAGNAKAVTGLGLTTANDEPSRSPTSYAVHGSNDNTTYTLISSGSLSVPGGFFTDYSAVSFTNTVAYRYYRVTFPTIVSGAMMQISEIRLPSLLGDELTYVENANAGRVLAGISIEDADTANLTGATVSITAGLTTGDVLALTNDPATMGAVTGTYDSATGVLTLAGSATPAQYQAAFRAVTFRNTTNNPTNPTLTAPTRTITWRVDDGQTTNNLSGTPTSTITVTETYATVSSIVFSSTSGSDSLYGIGDTVSVTATFSEPVFVTGAPRVPLVGLTAKYATYVSGSGSAALRFDYTVAPTDAVAGGLSLSANALGLNGGTIKDSADLPATITHTSLGANTAHAVDGIIPLVSAFTSAMSTPTNLVTLTYAITFSESVTGITGSDFINTGSADDCVFDPGSDTGATRTLTITGCSGGTVIPEFAATGAIDAAGNTGAATAATSTTTITRRHVRSISFATTSFAKTYGDAAFNVSATASRGVGDGSVTYTVSSGTCTVDPTNGTVTITGAGTCIISATVAQGTLHMTATTTTDVTVTIAKKALTITASSHAVTYGDAIPTVTPSYSAFAYSESATDLTTRPSCTTTYTTTSNAASSQTTSCSAAVSPNYAFTYVTGAVAITKQPVAVTFSESSLSVVFTGAAHNALATTSLPGKKLIYTYQSIGAQATTNAPVNAGIYPVVATVDETNYSGSATATMFIDKAPQTALSFANGLSMTFGSSMQLVAVGGSGSGTLRYAVISGKCAVSATGELTTSGAGSCVVRATKAASANHIAASSADVTIVVAKQEQTLEFVSRLPSSPIPGSSYIPGARASSGLTPTISVTAGADTACSMRSGVVTFIDKGVCVLTARQVGNVNFSAATSITQSITVGSLNQNITFAQPAEHRIGEAPFVVEASSSSGLPVAFTATGAACSVSAVGLVTIVAPGTCDITASQGGDLSYAAASPITRTLIVRAGLPGVPHLMSASPGDSRINASYSVPPTDGGSPILAYVVVATPNQGDPTSRSDCSATTLTCALTGLANGTPYRVKVAAVTEAGVGDFSAESEPVTPFAAPEAVRDLAGVRRDESLQLSWVDPPNLGGGTLVRYDVSYRERGTEEFSTPAAVTVASRAGVTVMSNPISRGTTLTGLVKGKTYDVKVVTVTSLSASPGASNTAEAVVPKMNVAEQPRNLSIEATSVSTATVAWATPLRDGGSPITSYGVTTTAGTCSQTSSLALSCDLRDVPAGATVVVSVRAVTRVGSSDAATARVTMPARPGAPKITSITRKGTSALIEWTAPTSDGGRAITSYRLRGVSNLDSRDVVLCSSTDLSCTVEGLAMSAAYTFTARAFNAVGEGATSESYFAQAFSAIPSVWGSVTESATATRVSLALPPAPGTVRVSAAASRNKSNVIAMAPKTSVPISHAIITVAGTTGRVLLRIKVAVDKSNPQTSVTIPYSSSRVRVAVQFANAYGVSALATNGWKPTVSAARLTDSAANVQKGVTAVRFVPVGTAIGAPVYFVGASTALSAAGKAELARIAAIVKRDGGLVNVTGYSRQSSTTPASFIKKISERRALAVANYLAGLGVQQWIRFQGVGAPSTKEGADTDRRVVVSLTPFD